MGEDGINWDEIIGQQPENGFSIGAGGTDVNGLTPQDWSEILGQAGQGLDPNGNGVGDSGFDWNSQAGRDVLAMDNGSGGMDWSKILSLLGGGKGIAGLAGIIASIGGGIYANNQSKHATEAALSRIGDTQNEVRGIFGGLGNNMSPYTSIGAQGAQMLGALPQSNIAGNFGPIAGQFNSLGTGRGIKLGALAGR